MHTSAKTNLGRVTNGGGGPALGEGRRSLLGHDGLQATNKALVLAGVGLQVSLNVR
jgi:hypothetical protein